MKRQKSCGPRLGKLVHQLPGVVTFAYDLRFRRVIARWKGIIEEIHFGGSIMPSAIIENLYLEKPSFRPSKWPLKLKPAKNSKLPKLPESHFEPFGKGGWPPISTWITLSCKNLSNNIREWIPKKETLELVENCFSMAKLLQRMDDTIYTSTRDTRSEYVKETSDSEEDEKEIDVQSIHETRNES
jgi:hypothetical protein